MTPKALVIVPTFNERENLPPLIDRLMKLPTPVEVLVVDDNSPDGTGQLADAIARLRASAKHLEPIGRVAVASRCWRRSAGASRKTAVGTSH
jgi:glycosyltransferase involved in cell wall biosynthesis